MMNSTSKIRPNHERRIDLIDRIDLAIASLEAQARTLEHRRGPLIQASQSVNEKAKIVSFLDDQQQNNDLKYSLTIDLRSRLMESATESHILAELEQEFENIATLQIDGPVFVEEEPKTPTIAEQISVLEKRLDTEINPRLEILERHCSDLGPTDREYEETIMSLSALELEKNQLESELSALRDRLSIQPAGPIVSMDLCDLVKLQTDTSQITSLRIFVDPFTCEDLKHVKWGVFVNLDTLELVGRGARPTDCEVYLDILRGLRAKNLKLEHLTIILPGNSPSNAFQGLFVTTSPLENVVHLDMHNVKLGPQDPELSLPCLKSVRLSGIVSGFLVEFLELVSVAPLLESFVASGAFLSSGAFMMPGRNLMHNILKDRRLFVAFHNLKALREFQIGEIDVNKDIIPRLVED